MTSPTRSKEADAVAILRSGGPFAEAMEQTHLSFDEVKAAWDRAQKPQQPHAIKAASLPIIAESLTSAAKHAYAATWVEGGAREHLVKLMLNDSPIKTVQRTSDPQFAIMTWLLANAIRREMIDKAEMSNRLGEVAMVAEGVE